MESFKVKKIICVILCASFLCNGVLFAGERNDVKKDKDIRTERPASSKKAKKKTPPPSTPRHRNRRDSLSDTLIEAFAELFVDLLIDVAVETNRLVVFDDYPYATSDYFIQYQNEEIDVFPSRVSQFSVGADVFSFPFSRSLVPTLRFSGFGYKWIGPYFESTSYLGFNDRNPYVGNFKAGFEIATFQTYLFSWSWNLGWVFNYGKYFTNGLDVGFLMKSYPFDPLIIEYICDLTACDSHFDSFNYDYYDLDTVFESYLEIGAMIDNSPWEVYVAWKYLYNPLIHVNENGYGVGFKYHF